MHIYVLHYAFRSSHGLTYKIHLPLNCAISCYGLFFDVSVCVCAFFVVFVYFAYFWFCSSKTTSTMTCGWFHSRRERMTNDKILILLLRVHCIYLCIEHTLHTLFGYCVFIVGFLSFSPRSEGSMDCQLNVNNCINQQLNFGHFPSIH